MKQKGHRQKQGLKSHGVGHGVFLQIDAQGVCTGSKREAGASHDVALALDPEPGTQYPLGGRGQDGNPG